MTKGVTDAPVGMTLDEVHVQMSSDFRSNEAIQRCYPSAIDPLNLAMIIVTKIDDEDGLLDTESKEQLRILWGAFYIGPLVSDRDFCFVMHTSMTKCPVSGEPVVASNSYSVDLDEAVPDMQATTGRLRATIQATGYIYRPHKTIPNRLSMSFLGQCNPKGYLPATIVNFASVSQAMNVGRIRDFYGSLVEVKKAFIEKDAAIPIADNQQVVPMNSFPFDCYKIPRRGGNASHTIPLDSSGETNSNNNNNNEKVFLVRLQAHCDHVISVQWKNNDTNALTMTAVHSKDKESLRMDSFVEGKSVTFGGKSDLVLDITVQVKLQDTEDAAVAKELVLEFTNAGWKQATLTFPVKTAMTKTASEGKAQ